MNLKKAAFAGLFLVAVPACGSGSLTIPKPKIEHPCGQGGNDAQNAEDAMLFKDLKSKIRTGFGSENRDLCANSFK